MRHVQLVSTSATTAEVHEDGKVLGDLYFNGTKWIGNMPGTPDVVRDEDLDECFLALTEILDKQKPKPELTLVK